MVYAHRTNRCVLSFLMLFLEFIDTSTFLYNVDGENDGAAHEHAMHAARLRMELAQSKREQRHYLKQVEIGKSLEKRKRKREKEGAEGKVDRSPSIEIAKADGNDKAKRRKKGEEGRDKRKGQDRGRENEREDFAREKRASDLDKVLGSIF